MRLLVLGAGAVGGYFGGRLAQSGVDVTFLVRERRAAQLATGLKIQSPLGDADIPARTITAADKAERFDIILLACKAYGLPGALEAIAPHVADGTAILPLLNGYAHLALIDAAFPQATVWGGVAKIPAVLGADGTVLHNGKLAGMIVGPRAAQAQGADTARALVGLAVKAGIKARFSDAIEQDLWDKWVFLATLAAATASMRADVGTILATTHGGGVLTALFEECAATAAAEGYAPAARQLETYRGMISDPGSRWKASMLHDLEAGNPTEADHILGQMIRIAESHNVATPMLKTALTNLQVYEASRHA